MFEENHLLSFKDKAKVSSHMYKVKCIIHILDSDLVWEYKVNSRLKICAVLGELKP